MSRTMDHDEMCRQQDRDLATLKTVMEANNRDLDKIVDRVQEAVRDYHAIVASISGIQADISALKDDVSEIKGKLDKFCAKEDFVLLRTQWYYFIGLIATGVLGAVLALVLRQSGKV